MHDAAKLPDRCGFSTRDGRLRPYRPSIPPFAANTSKGTFAASPSSSYSPVVRLASADDRSSSLPAGEGAVPLRRLGDLLRAADRFGDRAQRPLEQAHALVLGSQLEKPLLGVGGELDPPGELI
jgi:hypothetical protein